MVDFGKYLTSSRLAKWVSDLTANERTRRGLADTFQKAGYAKQGNDWKKSLIVDTTLVGGTQRLDASIGAYENFTLAEDAASATKVDNISTLATKSEADLLAMGADGINLLLGRIQQDLGDVSEAVFGPSHTKERGLSDIYNTVTPCVRSRQRGVHTRQRRAKNQPPRSANTPSQPE